jgi:hypothetical protein
MQATSALAPARQRSCALALSLAVKCANEGIE